MGGKQESIWDRIERFRRSPALDDVLWQRYVESWARDAIAEILNTSDDEFLESLRTFLLERTMLKAKTVVPILENNSAREVRTALSTLLDKGIAPLQAMNAVWSLKGAGVFFSSYMLALATGGKYIVYEKTLLEGMNDVVSYLVAGPSSVDSPEDYLNFMEICSVVREVYAFTSFAELHEFLWHGKRSDWTFK